MERWRVSPSHRIIKPFRLGRTFGRDCLGKIVQFSAVNPALPSPP